MPNCFPTDGFQSICREEGIKGLYRGTSLALVGVSNGAIQFMGYEKMKVWGFDRKRKSFAAQGREFGPEDDKLVCVRIFYLTYKKYSQGCSLIQRIRLCLVQANCSLLR